MMSGTLTVSHDHSDMIRTAHTQHYSQSPSSVRPAMRMPRRPERGPRATPPRWPGHTLRISHNRKQHTRHAAQTHTIEDIMKTRTDVEVYERTFRGPGTYRQEPNPRNIVSGVRL